MAIDNNTAKGEGYIACTIGVPVHLNPYLGIEAETICNFYDWHAGWCQAMAENKFGVECDV